MTYNSRYDDPSFIDAFLADLDIGNDDSPNNESGQSDTQTMKIGEEIIEQAPELRLPGGTVTPALASAASSPPSGIRAPPPTPESVAVKAIEHTHLPAIDEDERDNQAHSHLSHTRLPQESQFRPTAREFEPAPAPSHDPLPVGQVDHDDSNEVVKNYQSNTLHMFREQAEVRIAQQLSSQSTEMPVNTTSDYLTTTESSPTIEVEGPSEDGRNEVDATEPFPDIQDESTAISHGSDDDDSSINIIVDAPRTPESFNSKKSIINQASPQKSESKDVEIANPFDRATTGEDKKSIKEEPREDSTYFTTWGTPSTRTTAPARVRKIIISNLPASADYTLVQSLIHSGSIEVMTLSPASTKPATAYVIFTDADACDVYYKAYPNGISFKHQGKKHVAFVDKGQDVDVISSVVQSYLDCGASRVVKVVGADEEWSMRALYKVAEGPNARRKVEAILDSYRTDTRIIVFRFTKIADAVTFRGNLLRSPDWEDADIQFAADPCEKATGIHQD